jgi:hypothetical protein
MARCTTSDLMKRAARAQCCLAAIVLCGCVLLPRPGGAVLLVPLFTASNDGLEPAHIAVLRAGWLPGSLLVRVEGEVPVLAWLRHGILPLGAPAVLCSSRKRSSDHE